MLDDLLVAEDLAAAETTAAASHAAAAAASNAQAGRLPGRYGGFVDDRTRQTMIEAAPDGAVVLGNPVAPPVNGDIYTDISTENALFPGSRYVCFHHLSISFGEVLNCYFCFVIHVKNFEQANKQRS